MYTIYVCGDFRPTSDIVKDKVLQVCVTSCDLLTLFTFGFICFIISLSVCNSSKDMRNFRPKHFQRQGHNFMTLLSSSERNYVCNNLVFFPHQSQAHIPIGSYCIPNQFGKSSSKFISIDFLYLLWHSHARNSHRNVFVIKISCFPFGFHNTCHFDNAISQLIVLLS